MSESTPSRPSRRRFVASLVVLVVLMGVFGFALGPMYNAFCRLTGLNVRGTELATDAVAGPVDTNRTVLVQFMASTASGLPFDFQPTQREMLVRPGELYAASLHTGNRGDARIEAQAAMSYAPGRAARYVHKTECFCFARENFAAGERREMPLRFYPGPALPADVNVVTLAYTYYNVTPDEASSARPQVD